MNKLRKVAVVLESSHHTSRDMTLGVIEWVRSHEPWDLSITNCGTSDLRVPDLASWSGDGIISRLPNVRLATELAAANLPTVLIDPAHKYLNAPNPLSRFSSVSCDSEAVGRLAADFYLKLGYRSFAFAVANPELDWSVDRERTFREAVREAGGAFTLIKTPPLSAEREQPRLVRALRALPPRTALFAANDHRARDILRAATVAKIKVPDDLAVLGVDDDTLVCETTFPRLTSIAMDTKYAGYLAAEILAHHFAQPNAPRRAGRYLPTEIVERESAGLIASDDPLVLAALKIIREDAARGLRVSEIAGRLNVTLRTLELHFSAARISIKREIERRRLASIGRCVTTTLKPLAEIVREHGYASMPHFTTSYKKAFGITPASARRGCDENAVSPNATSLLSRAKTRAPSADRHAPSATVAKMRRRPAARPDGRPRAQRIQG